MGGALAAGALVLGACGGSGPSGGSSPPATAASGARSSGAGSSDHGCGSAPTPGSSTLQLTIAGRARTVVVHVPAGDGKTPVPLVLNLHGSGATALDQEAFTDMDATADAEGFIVAYPQGLIPDQTGYDWNVPGEPLVGGRAVPGGAPDDVTFLVRLVSVLEQRYCIDSSRVYAAGFSGGARMASQLACDASGVFAAVAPVSGLRRPTPCPTSRPVPVVAFHGTADPVDPYAGHGQGYWTYSVPQAAADWAAQDACSSSPTIDARTGVTVTAYGGCGGGAAVELYTLTGEGHEWPGGPVVPRALRAVLGPQSDAVDANAVMWAFFAAHPLPAASGTTGG